MNSEGDLSVSKACITDIHQVGLKCASIHMEGKIQYYHVNCCSGDLCNNNSVPLLESHISEGMKS